MRIGKETADEAVLGELGRRLAQVRLRKNLTQAQLAAKAGVSKRTVERLEVGGVAPQLSGFIRICRALDLLERFELLVPEPVVSPMALLKLGGKQRRRASAASELMPIAATSSAPGVGPSSGIVAEDAPTVWRWADET